MEEFSTLPSPFSILTFIFAAYRRLPVLQAGFRHRALAKPNAHKPLSVMVYICRKEHFNAAHKLHNPNWSVEKNKEIFGPCANENWHGHNFELIVTVKGKVDPERGYVMDLKHLSKIVKELVIDKVDHKNLNLDVDFLQGKMPSCEILVMEFWKILEPAIKDVAPTAQLHCLELHETHKNFVKYYGEE